MNSSKKKINILLISGSRADYGLLFPLIKEINKDKKLVLSLAVTGSHLSKKNDYTINEIIRDKIKIKHKIHLNLNKDTGTAISKEMGRSLEKFSSIFKNNKYNLMIVLGDRFEILPPVIAAYFINLPICHISGGEKTIGSLDDGIRHTITKLSNYHFVSTNIYKKRVIQLGENPKTVFNVGSLAIDKIKNTKLLNKKQIEKKLNFNLFDKNILVTFHPITNKSVNNKKIFTEILNALEKLKNVRIIFTAPNSDTGGVEIRKMIISHVKINKNSVFFPNLGSLLYLSILKNVDLVLGNSSSGFTEAPFLKTPTINISNRQEGRIKTNTIFDVNNDRKKIFSMINKCLFYKNVKPKKTNSRFFLGNGNASSKIISIIKNINLKKNNFKTFYDIKF